jgi:replication factor C subunit 3/5
MENTIILENMQEEKENTSINLIPWIEKYRPSDIEQVMDQDEIKQSINKFIETKNVPHLLLYGPPGTGKTTIANILASGLYKDGADSYNVLKLNVSEKRGIDTVRKEITDFVQTKSLLYDYHVKYKLVILDEADGMTADAQASLRSIIEKYTKGVRFCLICNYIKKIDIAIQSRCACFRFSPISMKSLTKRLKFISKSENIKISQDGIDTIIKRSKGDMRKLLNILQSVSMTYKNINEEIINNFLGYMCMSDIIQLLKYMNKNKVKDSYEYIQKIKEKFGYSLNDIINELYDYIIENKKFSDKYLILITNLGNIQQCIDHCSNDIIQTSSFVGAYKKTC